ncbi:MAG: DUF5696 domain-containing protein [Planctomycetaceae bacterium]|jgi:hypothetical protein|nr:DUF5696 domain-containing protein [Planctomycetaceae bacterium]
MRLPSLLAVCSILLFPAPLFAYTTHRTTAGPLAMYFETPERLAKQIKITKPDEPLKLTATLENKGDTPLHITLTFSTTETIGFTSDRKTSSQYLELSDKGTADVTINVVAKTGTLSAHYPIRLDAEFQLDGKTETAQIVQVIELALPGQTQTDPKQLPLNTLSNRGGLALTTLDTYRGFWNYDGKESQLLPIGFQGNEPTSAANISRQTMDRGGVVRQSFGMHPPWRGGVGNVGIEYRIKLPDAKPISLSFFSAMRDIYPLEPPSDGVTYRVKVDGKTVYEKHDATTDWTLHEVDLTAFAGKEILLTLESDPGPQRNTTCDQCFWGDVILFAGEKPAVLSAEEKQKLFAENLQAIKTSKTDSSKTHIFPLDGGLTGAITFGNNGFIDGVIGVGNAEKQVQFDGLRVWVKGQLIGASPLAVSIGQWEKTADGRRQTAAEKGMTLWTQQIEVAEHKGTLSSGIKQNGPALQFLLDASSDDLIDRIEFGPATHHAERVYYGHGYCIVEPEAFTAGAGGHDLSTSHVGMDFDNGLSVLQATSFPPDRFVVEPKSKRYTLSVHPGTIITLLPGTEGALDCAIRFRPLHEGKPAPGFATKAGRFVYDVWGGRYKEHTEIIKLAEKYGLTDSMFIVHDWQRYGYDNRLPDIYPPQSRLGTLSEMQETLNLCDSLGIQYGVHDNYIDFYPDADEYDFDVLTFHENGQPRQAWNNYGIESQSYQFRPDRIQPFLERNLDLLVPNLPMSTYFVDVFTSIPPIDFYDRDGNFHSRVESVEAWNKAFDTIRSRLSEANKNFPSATTSSEAGMDSLIGHLDGADCQFMFLSPEPGEHRVHVKCKDWVRVPWFDIVHHTKFSLHGVGYSTRYEAQRGRVLHGIESDDYIASEMLTGHSLMVDLGSAKRGAVRKYWLAQDLIRHLADKDITSVEFVDGNIKHQHILWHDKSDEGMYSEIAVNLDEKNDWHWDYWGTVLPPYGYATSNVQDADGINDRDFQSSIYKKKGRVVEFSSLLDKMTYVDVVYVNARQKGVEGLLPITPSLNSFQYLGENRFTATFKWDARESAPKDLCVFVHCVEQRQNWHHQLNEAVFGGGFPAVPTSQWSGEVITDNHSPKNAEGQPVMTVPDELPAGRYYFVVGLYDQRGNGQRAKLFGFNADADRYVVGWLNVQRRDGKVSNITLEPFEWDEAALYERLLPPKEPVEFGSDTISIKTNGAFQIENNYNGKTITLTPLPDEPATEVAINVYAPDPIKSVKAIDSSGKELRDVPFTFTEGERYPLVFMTQFGEFAYRIVW